MNNTLFWVSLVKSQPEGKLNTSGIRKGPLKLPDGVLVDRELIAFGEDENYLHCVISQSGTYYGVYKSSDKNHLYQHLLRLNVEQEPTP